MTFRVLTGRGVLVGSGLRPAAGLCPALLREHATPGKARRQAEGLTLRSSRTATVRKRTRKILLTQCLIHFHFTIFRSNTQIEYITGTSSNVTTVAAVKPPICA